MCIARRNLLQNGKRQTFVLEHNQRRRQIALGISAQQHRKALSVTACCNCLDILGSSFGQYSISYRIQENGSLVEIEYSSWIIQNSTQIVWNQIFFNLKRINIRKCISICPLDVWLAKYSLQQTNWWDFLRSNQLDTLTNSPLSSAQYPYAVEEIDWTSRDLVYWPENEFDGSACSDMFEPIAIIWLLWSQIQDCWCSVATRISQLLRMLSIQLFCPQSCICLSLDQRTRYNIQFSGLTNCHIIALDGADGLFHVTLIVSQFWRHDDDWKLIVDYCDSNLNILT